MGNTVAPRMCPEAVTGRRRPAKSAVKADAAAAPPLATPRRVAVMARKQQRPDDVVKEEVTRAGRRRGGGGGEAATVATVKIVLKRKDAEQLVARLNAQSARERKARMTEIKCELRARRDGGGASPPASCRDAWRPSLAPIREN
ncbi:hypothetical protein PR202_ga10118 [Eleusine coracana subsp. coracana]|uniref:Uncharacterized protein n=1 Tax=Eleusine coracana subsp. coracana TaxID=191504 RepID=A0AAV5C5W4_ELECO|nr:hypothetical protein QOZ80_1AG0028770 [Eleusine coracana subsp. coracana]GJM93554.1 hypothetical protein PR202_ga10118 [Eleusine coracana subsp. coracana]